VFRKVPSREKRAALLLREMLGMPAHSFALESSPGFAKKCIHILGLSWRFGAS
jgi:hypothetical protein